MIILTIVQDMLLASVPAVGFGLLFNVPRQVLRYCACLGALGHASRTLMEMAGLAPVFATFFAAALIGFIGLWLSKRYRAHPKVFTVSAIIPMIPGVYAYRAMIALLVIQEYGFTDERLTILVENFVQSGFLLSAIVFGLALPGLLFHRNKHGV